MLTPEIALGPDGPCHAQAPGGLSRWMAVPWQTDTASCQSGYDRAYDPLMPTFWAARVPNQVLTEADYRIATDPCVAPAERRAAFNRRLSWMRVLAPNYKVYINQMIRDFGSMGVVETRLTPPGDPLLPARVLVESVPGPVATPVQPPQALKAVAGSEATDTRELPSDKIHRVRPRV